MKDWIKYQKNNSRAEDTHVTSVNIRKDQRDFLKKYGLVLSDIVRDRIDEMMAQDKKGRNNGKL